MKHGKGTMYYKDVSIKYEGDFFNGLMQGNGKYIYEDGDYYIGKWFNNQKHSKGILYYKDGNIQYEGEFLNNNFFGNGKAINEDGQYYIGQFFNV